MPILLVCYGSFPDSYQQGYPQMCITYLFDGLGLHCPARCTGSRSSLSREPAEMTITDTVPMKTCSNRSASFAGTLAKGPKPQNVSQIAMPDRTATGTLATRSCGRT